MPPNGNRSTIHPGVPFVLPDIGPVTLLLRNDDLEWLEEEFEPELDKLNARIRDGIGPIDDVTGDPLEFEFVSVWDALDEILNRRVMHGTGLLLKASLAHRHEGDHLAQVRAAAAEVGQLPPYIYNDDDLGDALRVCLSKAFGVADGDEGDGAVPPPPAGAEA